MCCFCLSFLLHWAGAFLFVHLKVREKNQPNVRSQGRGRDNFQLILYWTCWHQLHQPKGSCKHTQNLWNTGQPKYFRILDHVHLLCSFPFFFPPHNSRDNLSLLPPPSRFLWENILKYLLAPTWDQIRGCAFILTIISSNSKYTDYHVKHKRAFFSKFASRSPDLKKKKKKNRHSKNLTPHHLICSHLKKPNPKLTLLSKISALAIL